MRRIWKWVLEKWPGIVPGTIHAVRNTEGAPATWRGRWWTPRDFDGHGVPGHPGWWKTLDFDRLTD
jgi:hypothetical protein